jgi:hypothetical protein
MVPVAPTCTTTSSSEAAARTLHVLDWMVNWQMDGMLYTRFFLLLHLAAIHNHSITSSDDCFAHRLQQLHLSIYCMRSAHHNLQQGRKDSSSSICWVVSQAQDGSTGGTVSTGGSL